MSSAQNYTYVQEQSHKTELDDKGATVRLVQARDPLRGVVQTLVLSSVKGKTLPSSKIS